MKLVKGRSRRRSNRERPEGIGNPSMGVVEATGEDAPAKGGSRWRGDPKLRAHRFGLLVSDTDRLAYDYCRNRECHCNWSMGLWGSDNAAGP